MASGVKLLAVLLLGILVTPFVTACGSSGDSSNPCDIVSRLDHAEIKITGPKMDGCGTEVRKEVRAWEFLGLGTDWQYGAPAPTGTPVCTVTSGEQTWGFYDAGGGGAAGAFCQMLKTRAGLHLWQEGSGTAADARPVERRVIPDAPSAWRVLRRSARYGPRLGFRAAASSPWLMDMSSSGRELRDVQGVGLVPPPKFGRQG
jgi:hypothetical protein